MHSTLFVCLFCFESHEQFFSYLVTVTITSDRAANLDLCLALTAYSSEGSFTCHTYCDTGPPFLRSYSKDPWFYLLNAVLLAKEQSLPILNVLGLTRPDRAGLELMAYRLLSDSTTTTLRQLKTSPTLACFTHGHFLSIASNGRLTTTLHVYDKRGDYNIAITSVTFFCSDILLSTAYDVYVYQFIRHARNMLCVWGFVIVISI
jgi:hypothetical protein